MTNGEWISLLNAAGTFLVGAAALWGVAVSKRGVAVSTENKTALSVVQLKQDVNKIEIKEEIQGVRHDIRNGGGAAIASAAVEQIKPVLEEAGKVITAQVTTQVAQTAAIVAAALAEKSSTWDGIERRTGPADRRGQEKETS